jgi:hypothetical protein
VERDPLFPQHISMRRESFLFSVLRSLCPILQPQNSDWLSDIILTHFFFRFIRAIFWLDAPSLFVGPGFETISINIKQILKLKKNCICSKSVQCCYVCSTVAPRPPPDLAQTTSL